MEWTRPVTSPTKYVHLVSDSRRRMEIPTPGWYTLSKYPKFLKQTADNSRNLQKKKKKKKKK